MHIEDQIQNEVENMQEEIGKNFSQIKDNN